MSARRINPSTIMEEEEEEQFSTQSNNNLRQVGEERRINNTNVFNHQHHLQSYTQIDKYPTTSKSEQIQNRAEYANQNQVVGKDIREQQYELNRNKQGIECEQIRSEYEEIIEKEQIQDDIQELLQYDESLYDLMRHKTHFKFYFGKDYSILSEMNAGSQLTQENELLAGIENVMNNYQCFNVFFFQKNVLYEKNIMEIHHSQSTEKNQLLHYLVTELLRDQAGKDITEQKSIAPEILYFDNSQQINYEQLKKMIKMKLFQLNYYKQIYTQSENNTQHQQQIAKDETLDPLFESISENSLSKLHVIESHSQLEFCTNIRSLKQILNKKKSVRVVIIDEVNAFFADNESTYHHHKATPSKDEDESVLLGNQRKKKKNTTHHHNQKANIQKQYDQLTKEYLQDVYKKYTRVSFIQTKRDYFKVRNLIEYQDTLNNFKANEELISILAKDDIDINSHLYKNNKDFEYSNIYCLSLDNFSNQALEKVLDLIRNDVESNEKEYVNPQKVSVVVKNNYNHDEDKSSAENIKLKEYPYQMNFYTFQQGDFRPLSDNTYYFS